MRPEDTEPLLILLRDCAYILLLMLLVAGLVWMF